MRLALRKWSITLVTATVTAAVLSGGAILVVGTGSGHDATPAPRTTPPRAGTSSAPRAPRVVGPEGVRLQRGAPLGPAQSPVPGSSRSGVPCGSSEQLTYHVHARLAIFVNGKPRSVPSGIGIAPPRTVTQNAGGPFVSGGSCFSWLHTHAADGIIHIEAPGPTNFTLGQFFAVWEQRLDARHLGRFRGRVVAYLNGRRYRRNPRAIPLRRHAQIQLEVGRPAVAPALITFPSGL